MAANNPEGSFGLDRRTGSSQRAKQMRPALSCWSKGLKLRAGRRLQPAKRKAKLTTGPAVPSALMPSPAAAEPPTPENNHLFVLLLAYRKSFRAELQRNTGNRMLVNWHAPLHAAAVAVLQLAPEMSFEQAHTFAWTAQAHHE